MNINELEKLISREILGRRVKIIAVAFTVACALELGWQLIFYRYYYLQQEQQMQALSLAFSKAKQQWQLKVQQRLEVQHDR